MKIIHCDQGSPEWHNARAGVITASKFKVARELCMQSGKNKGQPSGECQAYAFRLAIERISGEPLQDDQFETYAMRRGHELEPEARAEHEKLGIAVTRAGFAISDCGRFGASLDGTFQPKGASEYKCLVSPVELKKILIEEDLSSFEDQMQGGIMVGDGAVDYLHFGLYCPALRVIGQQFTLKIVDRDDLYIKRLKDDLEQFDEIVCGYVHKLRQGATFNRESLQLLKAAA